MKKLSTLFSKIPLLLLVGMVCFSSCADEIETDLPSGSQGPVVSFTAQLPSTMEVATRANGTVAENRVKTLDLLVFAKDGVLQNVINIPVTSDMFSGENNKDIAFRTRLAINSTGYDLMLLANASTLLKEKLYESDGTTLKSSLGRTEVRIALVYENSTLFTLADTEAGSIPMCGELKGVTVTGAGASASAFTLTRMMAKIKVVNAAGDNFVMQSIRYCNYNTKGLLVPRLNYYPNENTENKGRPSVPVENMSNPDNSNAGLVARGALGPTFTGQTMDNLYVLEAYTFDYDSDNWEANSPCLIIGGKYNGVVQYYRVDFIKRTTSEGGVVSDEWLNIQRNHSYNVTVSAVKGSGEERWEDALKMPPVNMMTATVDPWDDNDLGNIVADGQYLLAVSQDKFSFYRDEITGEEENNVLYIKTDHLDGWAATVVDADNKPVTWLKLVGQDGNPIAAGAAGDKTKVVLTTDTNTESVPRTAYILITAGRLNYKVTVTQSLIITLSLTITDGESNSITEFVLPSGHCTINPIVEQVLNVDWKPVANDLSVNVSQVVTTVPLVTGTNLPETGTKTGGSVVYAITPDAMTADEIKANPFCEKVSKVEFSTTNGLDYATGTVLLRQVNYAIVPYDLRYYRLNGSSQKFYIRSNAEWQIKSIHDDGDMIDFTAAGNLKEGLLGTPNIDEGTEVSFTTNTYAEGTSGVVKVVITSPDGLFDDYTLTLNFENEFALSNIIWIPVPELSTGGILTFASTWSQHTKSRTLNIEGIDVTIDPIPASVQGLFFQWGSLVAISPGIHINYSVDHVVFSPTGFSNAWEDIPSIYATEIINDYFDGYGPDGKGFNDSDNTGDICRYISDKGWVVGNWRMPTVDEYRAISRDDNVCKSWEPWGLMPVYPANAEKFGTNTNCTGGLFLGVVSELPFNDDKNAPVSGYSFPSIAERNHDVGKYETGENKGAYWSATSYNEGRSRNVLIRETTRAFTVAGHNYALGVRCIRATD